MTDFSIQFQNLSIWLFVILMALGIIIYFTFRTPKKSIYGKDKIFLMVLRTLAFLLIILTRRLIY